MGKGQKQKIDAKRAMVGAVYAEASAAAYAAQIEETRKREEEKVATAAALASAVATTRASIERFASEFPDQEMMGLIRKWCGGGEYGLELRPEIESAAAGGRQFNADDFARGIARLKGVVLEQEKANFDFDLKEIVVWPPCAGGLRACERIKGELATVRTFDGFTAFKLKYKDLFEALDRVQWVFSNCNTINYSHERVVEEDGALMRQLIELVWRRSPMPPEIAKKAKRLGIYSLDQAEQEREKWDRHVDDFDDYHDDYEPYESGRLLDSTEKIRRNFFAAYPELVKRDERGQIVGKREERGGGGGAGRRRDGAGPAGV